MARIVLCGHLCVDLAPAIDGPLTLRPGELVQVGPLVVSAGGLVANCARVLSRLGSTVTAHGAIGDDSLGRDVARELDALPGVEADLHVVNSGTSYSVVLQGDGWDRSFLHHVGANAVFDGGALRVPDRALVHIGYPTLLPALECDEGTGLVRLLDRVRREGGVSSLDLAGAPPGGAAAQRNSRAALERARGAVDVLCPSWDDILAIAARPDGPGAIEAFARDALDRGAAIALVSAGPRGFRLATARRARMFELADRLGLDDPSGWAQDWADTALWVPPPVDLQVRTTLGAGDTLKSAFLHALVRGEPVARAIEIAVTAVSDRISGRAETERAQ